MLLSFLFIGAILGLASSFLMGRDRQTYAAPSLALPAVKFIPCSLSSPKN
jgi:hypothetical protein